MPKTDNLTEMDKFIYMYNQAIMNHKTLKTWTYHQITIKNYSINEKVQLASWVNSTHIEILDKVDNANTVHTVPK